MARATYEHWLTAHRLTGLFVASAVVHGAIVDPVLHHSTLLRVAFLVIGGIGLLAYVYRELFARYVVPIYDFRVAAVKRLNESTLEVGLDPMGGRLSFEAGQFVFLAFGGFAAWQRHPFTVSSRPDQSRVTVTIKALGDYTQDLFEKLRPGNPAKVAGPFGGFDYRSGGPVQVWIAGGIGVTPFISWIRAFDDGFDRDVTFYYSVAREEDAIYLDEIRAASIRHPSFRLRLLCTDTEGRLSGPRVMDSVREGAAPSVYMCGPPAMSTALAKDLHRLGLPDGAVRWEQFAGR